VPTACLLQALDTRASTSSFHDPWRRAPSFSSQSFALEKVLLQVRVRARGVELPDQIAFLNDLPIMDGKFNQPSRHVERKASGPCGHDLAWEASKGRFRSGFENDGIYWLNHCCDNFRLFRTACSHQAENGEVGLKGQEGGNARNHFFGEWFVNRSRHRARCSIGLPLSSQNKTKNRRNLRPAAMKRLALIRRRGLGINSSVHGRLRRIQMRLVQRNSWF
jgi:hypothetical protein